MTTCALLLGIITCTSTAQRPTPADAVRILTASSPPYVYVLPAPRYGPVVAATGSRSGAGPWDWPEPTYARRLDGTLLTMPPAVYGAQPWLWPQKNLGIEPSCIHRVRVGSFCDATPNGNHGAAFRERRRRR